jgi:hypothetical protein
VRLFCKRARLFLGLAHITAKKSDLGAELPHTVNFHGTGRLCGEDYNLKTAIPGRIREPLAKIAGRGANQSWRVGRNTRQKKVRTPPLKAANRVHRFDFEDHSHAKMVADGLTLKLWCVQKDWINRAGRSLDPFQRKPGFYVPLGLQNRFSFWPLIL